MASCASDRPPAGNGAALTPEQARAVIDESIPKGVSDRAGWVNDIYAGFTVQGLEPNRENVCAVVAVIEQESNFQVDPVVPGMGTIAWKEIDSRAERCRCAAAHRARCVGSAVFEWTHLQRADRRREDREGSQRHLRGLHRLRAAGSRLFSDWNPIRTRGPMQVNVAYADQYAAVRPYPYPVKASVADELFTRRGSLYFGIAHLLAYQPPYDDYLYRFADFNAGQYASRNAAFQNAVSRASGISLVTDGALLSHERVRRVLAIPSWRCVRWRVG